MSERVGRVKGMYDVLPATAEAWHRVHSTAELLLLGYGYARIRTPIVEKLQLFVSAIGDETDVIGKEMYAFDDRGGTTLALRPEGTAGCVRAMIQAGLLAGGQTHKVWYRGPMFRRENVQRGRSRQFHQIGAEAFGAGGPDVDAEQIALLARLWAGLGIQNVRLEINTLGTPASRAAYREALVNYLTRRKDELDEDSLRRLATNPLRILDSKNPAMESVVASAPVGMDFLDADSRAHFDGLREILSAANVEHAINPRLVRGLDYYTKTVFEWITTDLGAQGTICGGGRYDGLVERQGGPATPAVGFSMGVERIVELLAQQGPTGTASPPDAYFVLAGHDATVRGHALAESVRSQNSALRIVVNAGGGSFKAQFKRADRSGARYAVVIGETEVAEGAVQLKPLRHEAPQQKVRFEELASALGKNAPNS